jgi:hypothetical protein
MVVVQIEAGGLQTRRIDHRRLGDARRNLLRLRPGRIADRLAEGPHARLLAVAGRGAAGTEALAHPDRAAGFVDLQEHAMRALGLGQAQGHRPLGRIRTRRQGERHARRRERVQPLHQHGRRHRRGAAVRLDSRHRARQPGDGGDEDRGVQHGEAGEEDPWMANPEGRVGSRRGRVLRAGPHHEQDRQHRRAGEQPGDILLAVGLRREAEAQGEHGRRGADQRLEQAVLRAGARQPVPGEAAHQRQLDDGEERQASQRRHARGVGRQRQAAFHGAAPFSDDGLRRGGRARHWPP